MAFGINFLQWADNPWVMHVYFLSLRLAAILVMTPILVAANLPGSIRALLILSLSVAIAVGITNSNAVVVPYESGLATIFVASLYELVLGATLSIGVLVAFAAISIAGRMLDIQVGFGMAQVFDPLTRQQIPILTAVFNHVGVIFFFLVNGHHTLLRAVAFSVEKFPLGRSWDLNHVSLPVIKQIGMLFSLGFSLASPVVFCILLVELALGVVARNLPQMNMFVVGIPVKVVVGLVALSLWAVSMSGVLNRIFQSIFQTWDWMFSISSHTVLGSLTMWSAYV